jgi:2-amino-4-hydroxy-6-hydroxymethyldihydropteridine diphosphokinase
VAEVLLGLGGNLGDPLATIEAALAALAARGVAVSARSRAYRTKPWGVLDQPDFVNLCARASTDLAPETVLAAALGVEAALGRERRERWGPRTIDVDLLAYDDRRLARPGLQLPHPRLTERAFVLVPLAEIAPDWVIDGRPVSEWAARIDRAGVLAIEGPLPEGEARMQNGASEGAAPREATWTAPPRT